MGVKRKITIKTTITEEVIDDYDSGIINTTYPNTWLRISIINDKVVIREVDLSEGDIENPHEVAGSKKTFFDFADKNNLKKFIDDLGT